MYWDNSGKARKETQREEQEKENNGSMLSFSKTQNGHK